MYIMKVKQANGQIIDIPFGPVANGITPHIGEDGYWYIGKTNTTVRAEAKDGITPQIKITEDKNWAVSTDDGATWEDLGSSSIPVKGTDYWTQDDQELIKKDVETMANDALSNIGQPQFLQNPDQLEEFKDKNLPCVLPDGHIYVYKTDGSFVNITKDATLDINGNIIIGKQYKNCCVTNYIPIDFSNVTDNNPTWICISGLKNLPTSISYEELSKFFTFRNMGYGSDLNMIFCYDKDYNFVVALITSDIRIDNDIFKIDVTGHGKSFETTTPIKYIRIGFQAYNGQFNLEDKTEEGEVSGEEDENKAKIKIEYPESEDNSLVDSTTILLLKGPTWENTGHTFGNRLQLYPKFANNIYELDYKGDPTDVYILPDNYLYVCMRSYGKHYLNHLSNAREQETDELFNGEIGFLEGYSLYSTTDAQPSQKKTANHFLTGWIPIETGSADSLDIYLQGCGDVSEPYADTLWLELYEEKSKPFFWKRISATDNDVYSIEQNLSSLQKITVNLKNAVSNGNKLRYIRLSLRFKFATGNNIVVSFNKPITSESTYGESWVKTPNAFVPADYEDQITQIDALQSRVKALEIIVAELKEAIQPEETQPEDQPTE